MSTLNAKSWRCKALTQLNIGPNEYQHFANLHKPHPLVCYDFISNIQRDRCLIWFPKDTVSLNCPKLDRIVLETLGKLDRFITLEKPFNLIHIWPTKRVQLEHNGKSQIAIENACCIYDSY
ncbi:hypothetical protein O6H91_11G015900 [Diphasiastrum complanatum]|uniref:Uncharacterized protein n=1 Tax=Diphasiastrum complanatum TaxID=34168 RepID=A0ACC2C6N5_DIPCM|nr:hypothetical protein O6H91_11G015900 [Diphasiastrum complanatum]